MIEACFINSIEQERKAYATLGELAFYGFVVWMVYMMTFRHKQFMELNEHMKGKRSTRRTCCEVPARPLALE